MKVSWGVIVIFCSYLIFTVPSFSATVTDLWQAQAPVEDRSPAARKSAASEALKSVLVKLTGSEAVASRPSLWSLIGNDAERYLESFQYRVIDQQTFLNARFSRSALDDLLQRANLPVWGSNRPSTLVWLVEDVYGDGKQNRSADPTLVEELQMAAKARGLPTKLPLLDLQDRLNLPADDLWALDVSKIRNASSRYASDAILVARFTQLSSGWRISWWLSQGTQYEVFDTQSDSLELGLRDGIGKVSEYFAKTYAVVVSGLDYGDRTFLQVGNIFSFSDYMATLKQLKRLKAIKNLQLQAVREESLLISVALNGNLDTLKNALNLNKQLEIVQQTGNDYATVPYSSGAPDAENSGWVASETSFLAPLGSGERPIQIRWLGSGSRGGR